MTPDNSEPFLAFLGDLRSAALFETWTAAGVTLLLLAGSLCFGLLAIPSGHARPFVRALAGIPLFFLAIGVVGIIAYLLGATVTGGLLVALALSVGAIVLALLNTQAQQLLAVRELLPLALLLVVGFALALFGWGETRDGTVRSMSGAWGDGALHTLIAEAFTHRRGPDLSMPAFAGEQLREPFGYDFVAAMLRRAGLTIGGAFTLPAAGLLASLLAWVGHGASMLSGITSDRPIVRRQRYAALIACVLVVTFGGFQWAVMASRASALAPSQFFGIHGPAWHKVEAEGLIWANHLDTFASQKHLLLASAFLAVLVVMLLDCVCRRQLAPLSLLLFSIATGLLPLFHMHAFLVAGLLWIAAWVASRSRIVLAFGVLAAAIGTPTVVWYSRLFRRAGFLSFLPGWMAEEGVAAWLWFWMVNLGVYLPLAALALFRMRKQNWRVVFFLGMPAVTLFALGNFVQFQPYVWDNYKVFLFGWLILLPLVAAAVAGWRFTGGTVFAALLVLLMSLTTLSEVRTHFHFRAEHPVYTPSDQAAAHLLERQLPRDAVVLSDADTRHNHPVTLTGRTLVAGYGGWLWTRAYPSDERALLLAELRQAPRGRFCALAALLGITHVVSDTASVQALADLC